MEPTPEDLPVGVALAGGASRRMGRDKATLPAAPWGRGRMIDWTVERLSAVCDEVVVADAGRGLVDAAKAISVADGPGRGPAAGILGATRLGATQLGAAEARLGRSLLVLACDLPCVTTDALRTLLSFGGGWVVPARQTDPPRLEPLASLFRPAALDALRRRVGEGRFDLHGLAQDLAESDLDVRRLGDEVWEPLGGADRLFANLNRPEDLERLGMARI